MRSCRMELYEGVSSSECTGVRAYGRLRAVEACVYLGELSREDVGRSLDERGSAVLMDGGERRGSPGLRCPRVQ
jgi:hypothetical protein